MTLDIYKYNPYPYPSIEYDLFLKNLIIENIWLWKAAYYNGDALVDDQVFDLWWKNLLWLEKLHPTYVTKNSPTQSPGIDVTQDAVELLQKYRRR